MARSGREIIKHDARVADLLPGPRSQLELPRASGRINDRHGRRLGPANRLTVAKGQKHPLRQGKLAAQRRVDTIVEQMIVKETVDANFMKIRLSVDQRAVMSGGHLAVN